MISLRRIVSWRMAAVTTLPVAIIAVLLWLYLYPLLRSGISAEQDVLAHSIAREVRTHLLSGERQLRSLAEALAGEVSASQVRTLLDAGCGQGEFFESVLQVSADGIIENVGLPGNSRSKREDLLGIDISGQPFFAARGSENISVSWSRVFLSTVSNHLAVAVTIRVRDMILVGEITLDNLSGFIRHIPIHGEMRIAMVDELGGIIADTSLRDMGRHLGDVLAGPPDGADEGGARSFVLDEVDMLGSVVGIAPIGWRVVVARSQARIFAPLLTCLALTTGAGVFALLICFLLSWRVAGGLSRLVNAYAERARSMAGGSYVLDWPSGGIEEFRELALSLQAMAATIGEREKQLIESENELRRLRNYLSNIINSMPSVLVAVDAEGNVTQWNNQAELATGLGFEEVRSRTLISVMPRLAGEMGRVRTSIQERRVIKSSKVPREMAGERRFEDITIFPLVANGTEGAVIRIDDVTDQVRMEEMVIQSEKMLTVGGLAAGMAHEINNPLAGVMQTAEVMSSRLRAHLDMPANHRAAEEVGTTMEAIEKFMDARGIPRMLDAIVASGRRISVIVENMLSFARREDAFGTSHHLDTILDKTIDLAATDYDLKKKYDFKQIRIDREYAENMPMVPCQETKLQQVILNILANGVHAMQTARTPEPRFIVRTYVNARGDMACMEIEDNGPGMDEATRRRVFDPFFTTKLHAGGTGLGLSVSYFIVTENHGGELDVESQPGAGAKFIIRLPLGGCARPAP